MSSQYVANVSVEMTDIEGLAKAASGGYGVPCKAFEPWMRVFEKTDLDAQEFFSSVGLDLEYVQNFDNEISWSTWVLCVERFEQKLGGIGAFEQHFRFGRQLEELSILKAVTRLCGLFASPSFVMKALLRWFGPSVFPGISASVESVDRNHLRGVIEIPEGWADSPAFFRLNRAAMMDGPMLVGARPAHIELDVQPRRGVYEIYLPRSGSLLSRSRRAVKTLFKSDEVLGQLEEQNQKIVRGYRRLERANQQLKQKQQQLEDSARHFRTLIERSTEAIAIVSGHDIRYANEAMARFLAFDDSEELLGASLEDVLVDPDAVELASTTEDDLDNPFDPARDLRFRRRDGEIVRGDVNLLEMEFEGRESTVIISRDVTKRRKMAARMMQMDRMIAVGTLASGVAHEINNPLTYVVTNTDFSLKLLGELRDEFEALDHRDSARMERITDKMNLIEESLEDAMHGGSRVKTIVRDLQTFSRNDERPARAIDVNDVVSNAVKMGWHEIKNRARLVQNLSASAAVSVDSSRLGQVVLNLLVNAAQAIPAGAPEANTIWLKTHQRDDAVLIEVRDTGSGISDQHMEQIFDPFFTTKPVGEGTGLGLSICKNLIEQMGGSLHIESQLDDGTRVLVTLPRTPTPEGLPEASEVETDLEHLRDRSVLVVDDDPMIGLSVARLLSGACKVTSVQSASAALDTLEAEMPDIVLCDVLMPQVDGTQLLERLQDEHPTAAERLIFMTGGAFSRDMEQRLRDSDKTILSKPFSLADLIDAFDGII